jgi:hypothetical protein
MANQVYASPGVYTSEKDLTFTTETLGVTTLGLVGETLKGPAFQPMFISNYDDFKLKFGGTNPEKFSGTQIVKYELPYIGKSYLTQSNQLYVTRVLGLSGYDAGRGYSIRTIGGMVSTGLTVTATTTTSLNFIATTGGTITVTDGIYSGQTLLDAVATIVDISKTKFQTGFNSFFSLTDPTTKDWYKNNALYYGVLLTGSTAVTGFYDASRGSGASGHTFSSGITSATTLSYIDSYTYPSVDTDETEYILQNEFEFDENNDNFDSTGFMLTTWNITGITGGYSGVTYIQQTSYVAPVNETFHKKTIAILRSRGSYSADILSFNITGASNVILTGTTNVDNNPYATFTVSGKTATNTNFTYEVSLDQTQSNYIKKVLGTNAYDKSTHLFVDETYDASLKMGWNTGQIYGIHPTLVDINNWNFNKTQYQSPITPFFVSELRGGLPQRLFRFISISDGQSANTEIKVSIANLSFSTMTFDVIVRSFNDSDKSVVILERFSGLSMDESQTNYIGRLIGTIDNKYPLLSSYIVVDMDPNAPADALPCGFEGYQMRTNSITDISGTTYCGVVELPYKTKYYVAGEVISTPPGSSTIISSGDKVRKSYLGFSDIDYGYDADLLKFKGLYNSNGDWGNGSEWPTKTTGFHMDVNAASILDVSGDTVFTAGDSSYSSSTDEADTNNEYYDIKTRKFTALFSGGFDGWDIYRKTRTNTNTYKIGRTGFVASGFDTYDDQAYFETYGSFGISDYYATFLGVLSFQNPEETSINILATPGIDIVNNSDLCTDTIEVVEESRKDSIYLPTLPDITLFNNTDPGNSESWFQTSQVIDVLDGVDIDSNYTAVYYPWIQINDSENNANVFIPPTAEVVRNLAYTDNVAYPWFATAGYNRGLVNCIRARMSLDQASRDALYPARINPIATFSDVGTVIWGNRNLQVANSALNRLNIRRLLLQARKLIMAVANRLLFDPNDAAVRSQFLSLVNPILDNIRKERGLTDFRVTLTSLANEKDRNTMTGKIFIKPTPTLEFIELTFVVTPETVSFDNIT